MLSRDTAHAALRFGLGFAPSDAVAGDPRGWLKAQLGADIPQPSETEGLPTTSDSLRELRTFRRVWREAKAASDPAKDDPQVMAARERIKALYRGAAAARLQVGGSTTTPYRERMVRFWSNHFCISADNGRHLLSSALMSIRSFVVGWTETFGAFSVQHH